MTTDATISTLISQNAGNVLVDLRTPTSTQAALGGNYPFICLFMSNSWVDSHKDVVQKIVNAYVKTLKYTQTHTAKQIADQMPQDYYAGNKAAYVQALQNQLKMFGPDGKMPADGPQAVLGIENAAGIVPSSTSTDLSATYTNEFASAAS